MKKINIIIILVLGLFSTKMVNASSPVEKYVKTTTYYDYTGRIASSFESELSKEEMEYELLTKDTKSTRDSNVVVETCYDNKRVIACHATEYKIIRLWYDKSSTNSSLYNVKVELEWKTTPLITKHDIIAIRWDGVGSLTTARGTQDASNKSTVNYPYGDDNMLVFSKGIGITMNMYDNTSNHVMRLYASFNGNPGSMYATYQHARHSNITFAMSQSYTIAYNGLGGVVYFSDSTIRGYYDAMKGTVDYTPTTV